MTAIITYVTRLAIGLAIDFWGAFILMFCLGWAHSNTPGIPNLGYWTTFAIVFALTGLVGCCVASIKIAVDD